MFVGFSRRFRRGLRLGVGMRITRRNFLYMILIVLIYYISYIAIMGTLWLMVGIVYFCFVWPIKMVVKLVKGGKRVVTNSTCQPSIPISDKYNHERSLDKGRAVLPAIPDGFTLKYKYDDVKLAVCKDDGRVGIGSIVRFEHEPHNQHDKNAVAVKIEDFTIGYLYRGNLQKMYHDFVNRGDIVIGCVKVFEYYKNDNFKHFELLVAFCVKEG